MVSKVALLNTFELFDITSEAFFFTAKCTKETQSTQSMYGAAWNSTVSEIRNAVWAATAHREADGGEYHPLLRVLQNPQCMRAVTSAGDAVAVVRWNSCRLINCGCPDILYWTVKQTH